MAENIYLKQIEITDLFGKVNVDWNLFRDVNILGGKNGQGKTTILKAVKELLEKGKIDKQRSSGLYNRIALHFNDGSKLYWFLKKEDLKSFLKDNSSPNKKINEYDQTVWILNDNEVDPPEINILFFQTFEQNLSEGIDLTQRITNKTYDFSYLDLHIRDEIDKRNRAYIKTMSKLVNDTSKGEPTKDDSKKVIDEYTKLYRAIVEFIPYFQSLDVEDYSILTDSDINIKLENLSTGEKQIMLLLLKISNNIGRINIFMGDEPDLGMHIDWKSKLIKALHKLNPSMQIIITTHSPSVIEGWYENVKEISQISQPLKSV